MPRPQHPLDGVAEELSTWLEKESDWYAQAIIGEYQAPFSAKASESEKLGFYRRVMYKTEPDGNINFDQPNIAGRQALLQRVGVEQYAQIAQAVGPGKSVEHVQKLDSMRTPSEEYLGDTEDVPESPNRYS